MKLTLVKTEEFGILIQFPENWDEAYFVTINIPHMGVLIRPVDFVKGVTGLRDFIDNVECFDDKWIITFNAREINDHQFDQLADLIREIDSFHEIKLRVEQINEYDATIAAEVTISNPEIDELNEELDNLLNKS